MEWVIEVNTEKRAWGKQARFKKQGYIVCVVQQKNSTTVFQSSETNIYSVAFFSLLQYHANVMTCMTFLQDPLNVSFSALQ